MKITLILLLALGVLPVASPAGEDNQLDQAWGFGWDDGLTARRQLGRWQIGLTAGPRDYKLDQTIDTFDSDLPDSLQGLRTNDNEIRREAGFVSLKLTRELAARGDMVFSGLLGGGFAWADSKDLSWRYSTYDEEAREYVSDYFQKEWDLLLG
ncbi:MAG: hypothetical protein E4H48_10330, partial [Syntrophobacterales bacterium]